MATKDIVYKKHKDYELILTVDFAETDKPAPFVVYIHGGGWARGDNGSSRSLSQYLAKQRVLQVYVSLIHWHRNPTQP